MVRGAVRWAGGLEPGLGPEARIVAIEPDLVDMRNLGGMFLTLSRFDGRHWPRRSARGQDQRPLP